MKVDINLTNSNPIDNDNKLPLRLLEYNKKLKRRFKHAYLQIISKKSEGMMKKS